MLVGLLAGLVVEIPLARAATSPNTLAPLPTAAQVAPAARPALKGVVGPTPGGFIAPPTKAGARSEIVSKRTANSKVFQLPNGDFQSDISQHPVHYKNAANKWATIDNHLVAGDTPGTFVNKANSWQVQFANSATGVAINADAGALAFAPAAPTDVVPVIGADGTSIVYRDVWPNADLVYHVFSDRIEEDIVLNAPTSKSAFDFRITQDTATSEARGEAAGADDGLEFADPIVLDKQDQIVPAAKPTLTDGAPAADGTDVKTVSVDATWLAAQPASAYPLTIDPNVVVNDLDVVQEVMYSGDRVSSWSWYAGAGRDSGGGVYRSVVLFDYAWLGGARIHNATVNFARLGGATTSSLMTVRGATAWNFDGAGPVLTSGNLTTSGSLGGSALANQFDQWISTYGSGGALMLQGNESVTSYKWWDLSLTLTYNLPPDAADLVAPAEGASVATLYPTLAVSPVTAQTGDPATTYRFQIFSTADGTGTPVWDSALYLADRSVTVNSAALKDGVTYTWRGVTFDGIDSTLGPVHSFKVNRRLGADGTQATDAMGPLTVNLGNGNVMTSVATPSVATVSGSAGVSLSYNSTAPVRT
ncbi:MAG: hypothetical protein QOF21_2985, partial [Actinomycetota bacterium]